PSINRRHGNVAVQKMLCDAALRHRAQPKRMRTGQQAPFKIPCTNFLAIDEDTFALSIPRRQHVVPFVARHDAGFCAMYHRFIWRNTVSKIKPNVTVLADSERE